MLREFEVPAAIAGRARAWLADGSAADSVVPVVPRPSATVLLLRDGAQGIEVFLLRRRSSMAFAAGMYAFPGGGVDPRDADIEIPWAGPAASEWARSLGADEPTARELVCAAVRETFEECGVLLAGPDADSVVADVAGDAWDADRQALLAREVALSELLAARGLVLRSDLLRAWGHWTTPVFEARRYDTRFFAAALPTGQRARDMGQESDTAQWWPAAEAVQAYQDGRLSMLPPTIVSVEELAAAGSTAAVLSAERAVRPVRPWAYDAGPDAAVPLMRVDVDGRGGGEPGPSATGSR